VTRGFTRPGRVVRTRQRAGAVVLGGVSVLLASCAVGPNYHRPAFQATASFKEQGDWKPSEPADAISRGPWWQIFKDPALDALEARIDISNQNVLAAAAAVEQAQALVRQAQAGFWPTIASTFGWQRSSEGALSGFSTSSFGGTSLFPSIASTTNTYSAGVTGNWQLDIWGQIRRTVESDRASAQSSEAALAGARLSAQGQLATTYFELRAQDQLQNIYDDIVKAQETSLKITQSRYRVGVAYKADVVNAQTQLLSSQAQQTNNAIQRGVYEHAIAVLVGEQPANLSVQVASLATDIPTVPPGMPSSLLERRPDVAQAERKVAAANAQIGVAVSSFFPSLTLTADLEYEGSQFHRLIASANRIWGVGPQLAETIFDAGSRRAQVAQARAAYEADVDSYRQTVLAGLQQVEDQLITLRVLEKQAVIEDALVKAAREAESLTLNQYKSGTVPYSSVITAQTTRLNAEVTALTVQLNRFTASVALIEALGGGWDAGRLK
jgi:NodT family efflux transporter outer membrane factor (OMF) lipoprotein